MSPSKLLKIVFPIDIVWVWIGSFEHKAYCLDHFTLISNLMHTLGMYQLDSGFREIFGYYLWNKSPPHAFYHRRLIG